MLLDRSVSEFPGVEIPPPRAGDVRMRIVVAGALVRPTSDGGCEVYNIVNMDPRISVVPTFLVNWVTRVLVGYSFQAFKRKVENGLARKEPYLSLVEAKKELIYDEMNRRLDEVTFDDESRLPSSTFEARFIDDERLAAAEAKAAEQASREEELKPSPVAVVT